MMKLVLDGYWWSEGPRSNRMVLLEIVDQWRRDYPHDRLILAVPKHDLPGHTGRRDGLRIVPTYLRVHPAINVTELPRIARRYEADAILAFNFAARWSPSAVFVHDVLFQSNPEWFTRIERAYYSIMPMLAGNAKTVLTSSDSEQRRIVTYNPKLRRVRACGLSVSPRLLAAAPRDPRIGVRAHSFFLCVGRLNIRKNLGVTLRALEQSGLLTTGVPAVVVGECSGRVARLGEFSEAIRAGRIVVIDGVSEAELKWLYANCTAFLCLSRGEGFGLPPVEAAGCGAPVLASDIPVFRESLGSYATFVDPTDSFAIADALRRMVRTDPSSQRPYVEHHSWSSVCEAIRQEIQPSTAGRHL